MIILGINAYHADASAAILKDGKLIAAIEEERFTRIKHWAGFPGQAVNFCLEQAGATLKDMDIIAIGRDPAAKMQARIAFLLKNVSGSLAAINQRWKNRQQVVSIEDELAIISNLDAAAIRKKILRVEHHRSHLASAFFASSYKEAAIVSIDGSGDFTTTMTGVGRENQMEVQASLNFPHSLGIFYSAFTQLLGFPHYGDEYKVMGLAPYGQPVFLKNLERVIELTDDGLFKLNLRYFTNMAGNILEYKDHLPQVKPLFGRRMQEEFIFLRPKNGEISQAHKNLAASVQRKTEEVIFHILNHHQKKTGLKDLCLAGGVAQNSVANGKIKDRTGFRSIYIPPAAHDAGISIGAALYVQHMVKGLARKPLQTSYLGSSFTNETIKADIQLPEGMEYAECTDEELYPKIVKCLRQGGVVGWFTGAAEFGPRALGGRSILADPTRSDAKELINTKIKRRESFRPFAPSILKEWSGEYFDCEDEVPFMEKVFTVKKDKRSLLPAVTHVDGTGRLQTVDRSISPRYYKLIETFYEQTGIPILLNTSFNENEPIVNHPQEAVDCFLRTGMDMLVLENIVIER